MLHRTIKLKSANALEVVNPLEATRFVYLDELPTSESERNEVYQLIVDKLSQEDGKYYIVISPVHSDELLQYINGRYPGYSDTLVAKTNLLINSTLEEEKKGERIDVFSVDSQSSDELISAISSFQTKCLIEMRPSLPEEAEKKKLEDRYCVDSLKIKANSENIVIFYAKKDNEIIATLTLNSHYLGNDTSEKILYASDLILEKNLLKSDFPEKFLRNIFNQIKSGIIIKNVKAVTLMAPGKDSDPLVSCLNGMKNSKLLNQLTTDQQSAIGIIPYFVQNSGASLNRTNYSEIKKNGASTEIINLFELYGITVDVVTEKNYTHYIHIHALNGTSVKLPIDPTDKTLMSSFNSELFDSLKDKNNKQKFFQTLSKKLTEEIGGKQLIVLSSQEDNLPDYIPPYLSGFDRLRFADPKLLKMAKNSDEEDKACQFLEENFYFINSEKALLAKTNEKERYQEIDSILEHANFTQSKQNEYKEEELQGKASRFKSDFITPIVLLNKRNKIVGMIRALNMGDGFYYLSDEVMNQNIIPLDFFKGDKAKRERFLLKYLIKHTLKTLEDQGEVKYIIIIAAEGRTETYDYAGLKTFENPLLVFDGKLVMKFSSPGPELNNLIEKIKSLPFEPTNLQSSASNHGMFFPSRDNEKNEEAHSPRQLNLA